MIAPCAEIESHIGSLFSCSRVHEYIRIRTPFMYPDGDLIDVFLKEHGTELTLTDLGETLRWLRMQTTATVPRRTPKQRRMIEDICLTQGIELYRGMLTTRLKTAGELAEAVTRLSQACLRVSDLWLTFRIRSAASIAEDVADLLDELKIYFDRGEKLAGRSGRIWNIDFHTFAPKQSALVQVLSTGTSGASHHLAERAFTAWYDLTQLRMGTEPLRFATLFDDTVDVWSEEDFTLLRELSDISYWSRPDEFASLLTAA